MYVNFIQELSSDQTTLRDKHIYIIKKQVISTTVLGHNEI